MEYPRVETCSECGSDFWAEPKDNGICFSCFHKMRLEQEEAEKAKPKPEPMFKDFLIQHRPMVEPERRPGYVYIMKSSGWHKIGMTSRESGRLDELRSLYPIIKLIQQIACDDAGKVETYLHKKFKKQRITHEWYKLTKEDIAWFKSLKDHDLDQCV